VHKEDGKDGLTMRSEVGDASDGVALDFNVGREHLTDQRIQSAELDDQDLVLRCTINATNQKDDDQHPSEIHALREEDELTVDCQVAQRSTGGPLDLVIMAAEEEEDRVEGIPSNLSDLLLGDLSKGEGGGSLKVDVVGKGERS
jgi:hypothetical protein